MSRRGDDAVRRLSSLVSPGTTLPGVPSRSDRQTTLLLRTSDVTLGQRGEMFDLLCEYYDFATREQFEADLEEKEAVIVRIADGRVVGFSTLTRFGAEVDGSPVTVFYSGDTVTASVQRGRQLTSAFAIFLRYLFDDSAPDDSTPRYYLHVAGTWRGYLMVPAFFRVFRPRYDQALTPDDTRILSALTRARGLDYDPARSIVRFRQPSVYKQGGDRVPPTVMDDPHVRFFLDQNSGYLRGERLVSLVDVTLQNLTPAARRLLAASPHGPA